MSGSTSSRNGANNKKSSSINMNNTSQNNGAAGFQHKPPTLWSFHFATCRWIHHPVYLSPSAVASASPDHFSLPILTNRLNENNTDPFETKYALVATGSDTLLLWGGCLDRDHVAVRMKLSVEGAQGNSTLHHQQEHAFGGVGAGKNSNSVNNGSLIVNNGKLSSHIGIALPLPLHRQMRAIARKQGTTGRIFNVSSSETTGRENSSSSSSTTTTKKKQNTTNKKSKTENSSTDSDSDSNLETKNQQQNPTTSMPEINNAKNSGNNNANPYAAYFEANCRKNLQNPNMVPIKIAGASMLPVVRMGTTEQIQNWKINFYNEQLEWLFSTHAKDKKKIQSEEQRIQQQITLMIHNNNNNNQKNANTSSSPSSSSSPANSPRFMRSTSSRTNQNAQDNNNNNNNNNSNNPMESKKMQLLQDEMIHRKHAPTSIVESNHLASVSTSVAWPLYPMRCLPHPPTATSSRASSRNHKIPTPPLSKRNNNNDNEINTNNDSYNSDEQQLQQQQQENTKKNMIVVVRWMLVRRYVKSGWAKTGIYPFDSSMQSWKDGRVIPKI